MVTGIKYELPVMKIVTVMRSIRNIVNNVVITIYGVSWVLDLWKVM